VGILRRVCKELSDPSVEIDTSRRVSVVLDEFFSLGKIEGVARALSVAREKGLTCIIALQSKNQLDVYENAADLCSISSRSRSIAASPPVRVRNGRRSPSRPLHLMLLCTEFLYPFCLSGEE
jgi:hypothetical protein